MTSSAFDEIFHEDARNLQSVLAEEFDDSAEEVDAIITSPPYADMQDYGEEEEQIGEQAYEDFLADLTEIFRQCYEVAADDATLWVITDTYKRHNRIVRLPFDIADEVENLYNQQECGDCSVHLHRLRESGRLQCPNCERYYDPLDQSWRMEDHIIWDKKRTRPWRRKGQLRNTYEHISMFSKSDDFEYNIDDIRITDTDELSRWWVDYPERYNPKGKVPTNIWRYEIPKQGQWGPKLNFHPSPFPEALVERIVRLATDEGDTVLDPFAGVGTTLAVARKLGRNAIGFELNQEFIEFYTEHLRPGMLQKQQTLVDIDEKEELARAIWSLRIHKYALKLYRELLNLTEIDLRSEDVYGVLTIASEETLTRDQDRAVAEIYYLTTDRIDENQEVLETARQELTSGLTSSGNYYELDINATIEPLSIADFDEQTIQIDEFYLYRDGTHHWYDEELSGESIEENFRKVRNRQNEYPPLISNLGLKITNPYYDGNDGKTRPHALYPSEDDDQADIRDFGSQDVDDS